MEIQKLQYVFHGANTAFKRTSKEWVLAAMYDDTAGITLHSIWSSFPLFLAYFMSKVQWMHAGCCFWNSIEELWMITPTSTHWNCREISVTNIFHWTKTVHLFEWDSELCRPCFREFCAFPEATYRLKVSTLSWCSEKKKRDIFLPIAICMTCNTTYPGAGEG